MKTSLKAGLLIVTLVIPALIFLFLRLAATNHYDLPYFNPQKDRSGEVRMLNGDTVFVRYALTGNLKLHAGPTILYLSESPCIDTCQLVSSQMERVTALKAAIPELNLLRISLTEERKDSLAGKTEVKFSNQMLDLMHAHFGKSVPIGGVSLLDENGFVRGYYDGADAVDIDRLMAEIKILDYEKKTDKK